MSRDALSMWFNWSIKIEDHVDMSCLSIAWSMTEKMYIEWKNAFSTLLMSSTVVQHCIMKDAVMYVAYTWMQWGMCIGHTCSWLLTWECVSRGLVLLAQDCLCLCSAPNSPSHLQPLLLWGQNTRSSRTVHWKRLFSRVVQLGVLHKGQAPPTCFILSAASSERYCPQHEVTWGTKSGVAVTGQKISSGGFSTNSSDGSTSVCIPPCGMGWGPGLGR